MKETEKRKQEFRKANKALADRGLFKKVPVKRQKVEDEVLSDRFGEGGYGQYIIGKDDGLAP